MNDAAPAPEAAPVPTRRPADPPTRESIVSAARALFLERGYRGTTLRAVAGAAGVDPALIAYHFGSKKSLSADVMQFQCADALAVDDVLGGDPATLPDRLIDAVTDLWEDADFVQLTTQGEEAADGPGTEKAPRPDRGQRPMGERVIVVR